MEVTRTSLYVSRRLFLLLFFTVVLVSAVLLRSETAGADGASLDGKNVLVLHSYHQTYVWTDQEMEGIMRVFRETSPDYMPYVEYLDWKRFPDEGKIATIRETLRAKYAGTRIDAVIVTDNKALVFALENRAQLFPGAAISFCGINGYKEDMIHGHERVSGVVEDVDPAGTIALITALLPETREIVVLLDDTESSNSVLAVIQQALADRKNISLRVVRSPDQNELISTVSSLKDGSVLLQGPYLRDRTGRNFSFENVLERILPHTRVPIFSLWEFLAGKGITGGSLLSGVLQGENAARIALRLMSGEKSVPVMTKSPSRVLFDYRQLKRFGLENLPVPSGVEVIKRPVSFVETYFKTIVAVLLTIVLLVAIIAALVVAIRRKQQAEKSLRQSEERFRMLVENSSDVIFVLDANGVFQFVSPSWEKHFGYPVSEVLQQNFAPFVHPDDVQPCVEYLKNATTSGEPSTSPVYRVKHRDGRWRQFIANGSVHLDPSGSLRYLGIGRDITDQIRAEEERFKLEQQQLHTQKLESLGVLAGGIAHDFNNILTAIIGNADLALMRINRESPAVDNLHRIEQAASRAADLARQMLAYSGRGKFVVESLDMNRLLEEMLHMLEVSISKNAVLRFNLTRPLPTVEADATQMQQIVMNLIINASEAIGDKSGIIAITTGCMECDRNYLKDVWLDENLSEGLYVYLEVADNGSGMDGETLARIFDPFFTTKFTGRGLGMAAVMGIVRGHHGAINVYSEPGKGSSFKILLPASGRPVAISNAEAQKDDWHGSGTVLLVDDEEYVRGIGSEMLKELGFKVITANDGREAVDIFIKTPAIAFVVLDLTMPHMDGEQCFRELRQLDPEVKVIMSSGYNEQEVTQRFIGKGLSGFIPKPYKFSAMKEVIRNI